MNAFGRTLGVAAAETRGALRSMRAVLMVALFVVAGGAMSYGAASLVAKTEVKVAEALQIKASGGGGAVTKALWKSKPFRAIVRAGVRNEAVFADITGRNPLEIIYAFIVFTLAPLLAAAVSANRIADDIGSGAVRYMLLRVRRAEWVAGKFLGQIALILPALAACAAVSHAMVAYRLPAADVSVWAFVEWSFAAWFVAIAWTGISLGVSQQVRSGAKATILAVLALAANGAAPKLLALWNGVGGWRGAAAHLDWFFPAAHEAELWISSPVERALGALSLAALGAFWLAVGYSCRARRDM